jgi:hypothetical protein
MKVTPRGTCSASCISVFIVALSATVGAQTSPIDAGSISQPTFGFYWETHLQPAIPALSDGFGTATEHDASGTIHRVLLDRTRRVYFGYDVKVETLPSANMYRLTFGALSMTPAMSQMVLGTNGSDWSMLPPPGFPDSRTVRGGDVLQLNLLTNSSWGQTLVDYVTVQEPPRRTNPFDIATPREFAFAPGSPRDFRADDVDLRLQAPRVSINGRLEESSLQLLADVSGHVVWLYLPGRGRFLLSLTPHTELGFRKAGEVRGSSLRFTLGGETFSLTSGSRIAPGTPAFNLYVLHDPAWRPTYAHANLSAVMIGAADRADYVARK